MQKQRFPSIGLSWFALLTACGSACGMGFGASSPAAILGQTLDFTVALRLEPGETLDAECVRAEVSVGDITLPRSAVATSLLADGSGALSVRVRTQSRIDEPVVAVQLAAGCPSRLARRFVVFADPPLFTAPPEVLAAEPAVVPDAPPRPGAAIVAVAVAAGPSAPAPVRGRPARRSTGGAVKVAAAPRARLQLDAAPQLPAPALASASASAPLSSEVGAIVDQANEAVKAAIVAASASQGRIAALEASVQRISAEASTQRDLTQQLRDRASAAEATSRWVMPLALALLALLGLVTWMWLRLQSIDRERQQAWQQATRKPVPADRPLPPSPSQVPLLVERSVRTAGAAALGAGLAPAHQPTPSELPDAPATLPPREFDPREAMQQTQPLVPAAPPAVVNRGVSADELIDLEQQAEFFVVLGQDEPAIDLLVSHLRDSGGASPLPYLKLLEIYRRRGEREAHDRTRDRFNHRFNAHAPAWDAPPHEGRSLEDYPRVMGWLAHVWPRPLDAMAELESLLFRRDGGELFDLPAYREVLFLYALARDVLDADNAGGASAAPVDVLLPLSDGPGFSHTTPRPYFGPEDARRPDDQPTAPVDLDLTESMEPSSRFGRF